MRCEVAPQSLWQYVRISTNNTNWFHSFNCQLDKLSMAINRTKEIQWTLSARLIGNNWRYCCRHTGRPRQSKSLTSQVNRTWSVGTGHWPLIEHSVTFRIESWIYTKHSKFVHIITSFSVQLQCTFNAYAYHNYFGIKCIATTSTSTFHSQRPNCHYYDYCLRLLCMEIRASRIELQIFEPKCMQFKFAGRAWGHLEMPKRSRDNSHGRMNGESQWLRLRVKPQSVLALDSDTQ